MMLSERYRPKTWTDFVGQPIIEDIEKGKVDILVVYKSILRGSGSKCRPRRPLSEHEQDLQVCHLHSQIL